jgi:hypothetical protein
LERERERKKKKKWSPYVQHPHSHKKKKLESEFKIQKHNESRYARSKFPFFLIERWSWLVEKRKKKWRREKKLESGCSTSGFTLGKNHI